MMQLAIQEPYMLMVQPDDFFISPRKLDENFGTMICFHRRYDLGDEHNYGDNEDFLKDLYLKTVGNDEKGEEKYDRLLDRLSKQPDTPFGSREYACAVNQALMAEIEKEHIVLPTYLYDHSALAMSTDSFIGRAVHAEWDSGQVGWIYVSKADIRAEYQVDRITPSVREQAENRLKDEVRIYDAYLRGECYGYELYKNGELTDSCWGFVGSFDEAIKDIAEYLPDECKGMTEKLAEVSDPASMVKTLLKHARIQVEQAAKEKSLGKALKEIGLLIMQDCVWNRVTANRSKHKTTWFYIDEFHLLLKGQTGAFSVEIWKRFRKWGGIPSGLTQNVKDLLASREIENIFENSDFIYMLNQAQGDRQILAKQLGISPHQLSYVTHSGPGEGLLFFGNVIIPFVDHFPKDSSLYRVMTTRPDEVAKNGE